MARKIIVEDNTIEKLEERIQKNAESYIAAAKERLNYRFRRKGRREGINALRDFPFTGETEWPVYGRMIDTFYLAPRLHIEYIRVSDLPPEAKMILLGTLIPRAQDRSYRFRGDDKLALNAVRDISKATEVVQLSDCGLEVLLGTYKYSKQDQKRYRKIWTEKVKRNSHFRGIDHLYIEYLRFPYDGSEVKNLSYLKEQIRFMVEALFEVIKKKGFKGFKENERGSIDDILKNFAEKFDGTPFGGEIAQLSHAHDWTSPPEPYFETEGHPQNRD